MRLGIALCVALLLTTPVLAGCLASDDPTATPEAPGEPSDDRLDRATVPGFEPNRFLLDGARPHSTFVSEGAEPIMFSDREDGVLLIGDTLGVHRSTDRGETWARVTDIFDFKPGLFGDGPGIAQDDEGVLYAADTNGQIIDVARSTDGGATWTPATVPPDVSGVADRPWIAATGDGIVSFVVFEFEQQQETCYQSTDGGQTFPTRSHINGGAPNAGNLVYTDDGALWYAQADNLWWWTGSCMDFPNRLNLPGSPGPQIFTQVDTDGDAVYAAYPLHDSSGLRVAATQTGSSARDIVLTPEDGTNALVTNTFTTISVTDDEVAIGWYGSETDGNPASSSFSGSFNVFTAQISDFWTRSDTDLTCTSAGVTCTRVTDEPNHVGGLCMSGTTCTADRDLLDYFGIDHDPDGALHVAYGHDGAGSNAVVRYACIGDACTPDNLPPTPSFTAECSSLSCVFDASATTDPDGDTLSFNWDFGDGNTATGEQTSHTFTTGGPHEVTLEVSDGTTTATLVEEFFIPTKGEGKLGVAPIKPNFDIDEPVEIQVTVTDMDDNPIPGVPVDVLAHYDPPATNSIHQGRTFLVMETLGIMYHTATVTTGEDGTAIWTVPSDLAAINEQASGPSGTESYRVEATVDPTNLFASTTYTVGPSL